MKKSPLHLTFRFGLHFALAGSAAAQAPQSMTFAPDAGRQINFDTPSHNVGCTYTPAGDTPVYKPFDGGPELSCDRVEPQYVRVVLTPKNVRRFDNVGDPSCCGFSNILAYGARWSFGPFVCDSAESGLVCKRTDGRGFTLSRAGVKLQ